MYAPYFAAISCASAFLRLIYVFISSWNAVVCSEQQLQAFFFTAGVFVAACARFIVAGGAVVMCRGVYIGNLLVV